MENMFRSTGMSDCNKRGTHYSMNAAAGWSAAATSGWGSFNHCNVGEGTLNEAIRKYLIGTVDGSANEP